MTLVSNDPFWWPLVNANRIASYFIVAGSSGVIYDWALTLGREIDLIWSRHWSLMTVLYLSVRYVGILMAVLNILVYAPTIPMTDVGCRIIYIAVNCMILAVNTMLGVIMTTRLYAMYRRSRKVLIFLVVTLLVVSVTNGVIVIIGMRGTSEEEYILFGTYQCIVDYERDVLILKSIPWLLSTVWEVIALCLAVWIAVEHFRELQRQSAGGIIGDCVKVLMQTHVVYFTSFVVVSCFWFGYLSPTFTANLISLESEIYRGFLQIILMVQTFVVGPRLILSVREYHAELKAKSESDAGTPMTPLTFQESAQLSTSSSM